MITCKLFIKIGDEEERLGFSIDTFEIYRSIIEKTFMLWFKELKSYYGDRYNMKIYKEDRDVFGEIYYYFEFYKKK